MGGLVVGTGLVSLAAFTAIESVASASMSEGMKPRILDVSDLLSTKQTMNKHSWPANEREHNLNGKKGGMGCGIREWVFSVHAKAAGEFPPPAAFEIKCYHTTVPYSFW